MTPQLHLNHYNSTAWLMGGFGPMLRLGSKRISDIDLSALISILKKRKHKYEEQELRK